MILEVIKPLFQNLNMSTTWVTLSIIGLGIIGLFSLISEVYRIYNKGWSQRIIAGLGFLSFLFLVIGVDTLGIMFLFSGVIMVIIFPDE